MVWIYVIVLILVGYLLISNGLYAFRQFLSNRNHLLLGTYFFFLIVLGYLLLHVTKRMMDLVQTAKEVYTEPGP